MEIGLGIALVVMMIVSLIVKYTMKDASNDTIPNRGCNNQTGIHNACGTYDYVLFGRCKRIRRSDMCNCWHLYIHCNECRIEIYIAGDNERIFYALGQSVIFFACIFIGFMYYINYQVVRLTEAGSTQGEHNTKNCRPSGHRFGVPGGYFYGLFPRDNVSWKKI